VHRVNYQQIAINRTVEAIAQGQNRVLLVMATGTGKTYTAFQIIYRLWKNGRRSAFSFSQTAMCLSIKPNATILNISRSYDNYQKEEN